MHLSYSRPLDVLNDPQMMLGMHDGEPQRLGRGQSAKARVRDNSFARQCQSGRIECADECFDFVEAAQ